MGGFQRYAMKNIALVCALFLFGALTAQGEGFATTTIVTAENISDLDDHSVVIKVDKDDYSSMIVVEMVLREPTTTVNVDVQILNEHSGEVMALFSPKKESVGKRAEARGVRRFEFMVGNSQLKNVSLLYSMRFPDSEQANGYVLRWPALKGFVVER